VDSRRLEEHALANRRTVAEMTAGQPGNDWHLLSGRRGWAKTARTIDRDTAGTIPVTFDDVLVPLRKLSLYEATQLSPRALEQIDESLLSACDPAKHASRSARLPHEATQPPPDVREESLYDVVMRVFEDPA
jgi:hypothetical protein